MSGTHWHQLRCCEMLWDAVRFLEILWDALIDGLVDGAPRGRSGGSTSGSSRILEADAWEFFTVGSGISSALGGSWDSCNALRDFFFRILQHPTGFFRIFSGDFSGSFRSHDPSRATDENPRHFRILQDFSGSFLSSQPLGFFDSWSDPDPCVNSQPPRCSRVGRQTTRNNRPDGEGGGGTGGGEGRGSEFSRNTRAIMITICYHYNSNMKGRRLNMKKKNEKKTTRIWLDDGVHYFPRVKLATRRSRRRRRRRSRRRRRRRKSRRRSRNNKKGLIGNAAQKSSTRTDTHTHTARERDTEGDGGGANE